MLSNVSYLLPKVKGTRSFAFLIGFMLEKIIDINHNLKG